MSTVKKKVNKKGVVYRVDWYDPEGNRKRKDFEKKGDADAYKGLIDLSKKEKRYHDVFDVKEEIKTTFNELAEKYQENHKHQKSWENSNRYNWLRLKEHFGEKQLSEITPLDLETYRNKRKATPVMGGKPRTDATVNREMALLGKMFNKAVEWKMMKASPFKSKSLMAKENNKRLRFLTEPEIEALMKESLPHLKPIVEVALHTGMRRGELLSLKWEQIRNGFIYLTETKSNKARQIPINDRLHEIFRELRQKNQLTSPFVFCDLKGRRFGGVKHSFMSACRRAGIENFRFHDLRHTFASHLVMNGIGLKAVQELLGHADMKMTLRYAHLSGAHLQAAVSVLNNLGTGHQMDTKTLKSQKADNLAIANPL